MFVREAFFFFRMGENREIWLPRPNFPGNFPDWQPGGSFGPFRFFCEFPRCGVVWGITPIDKIRHCPSLDFATAWLTVG